MMMSKNMLTVMMMTNKYYDEDDNDDKDYDESGVYICLRNENASSSWLI